VHDRRCGAASQPAAADRHTTPATAESRRPEPRSCAAAAAAAAAAITRWSAKPREVSVGRRQAATGSAPRRWWQSGGRQAVRGGGAGRRHVGEGGEKDAVGAV